jgi:hypothetical protein
MCIFTIPCNARGRRRQRQSHGGGGGGRGCVHKVENVPGGGFISSGHEHRGVGRDGQGHGRAYDEPGGGREEAGGDGGTRLCTQVCAGGGTRVGGGMGGGRRGRGVDASINILIVVLV